MFRKRSGPVPALSLPLSEAGKRASSVEQIDSAQNMEMIVMGGWAGI
jgi:hypothetical protein